MPRYDFWERSNGRRLAALKETALFVKHLLPDIRRGEVFPAFRGNQIHFYFKGRKLFGFSSRGFQTNIAFLAAFDNRPSGEVKESSLSKLVLCSTFADGYGQIKKNIELYVQPESREVAELCQQHSICRDNSGPIVVLDVELSLESDDEDRKQDRIDLVLFNMQTLEIRLFEVKTFDDERIWPKGSGVASVVGQMRRYRRQATTRQSELLENYRQYVSLLNLLYNLDAPLPESIATSADLLVVRFDANQQQQLVAHIIPAFRNEFVCSYIGKASRASQNTIKNKWWKNGQRY